MGTSNFYLRSFGENLPTEIVSRQTLETGEFPFPLEYVGPTGERDEAGLAKRVAAYLDLNDEIEERNTVTISQEDSTIIVTSQSSWDDAVFVVTQMENDINNSTSRSGTHLFNGISKLRIERTSEGDPHDVTPPGNPHNVSPSPTPTPTP